MHRFPLLLLLVSCGGGPSVPAPDPPRLLQGHPRLLCSPEEVERARRWREEAPWYRDYIDRMKTEVDSFVAKPVYVSPLKWKMQYKDYDCPEHDVKLKYEWDHPHDHLCPKGGERIRGDKYDANWASWYHQFLAQKVIQLGTLYQLLGEPQYAVAARDILVTYARNYHTYPNEDNLLGPARVTYGTLSESVWGTMMTIGYDLVHDDPCFTTEDHATIRDRLIYPLAENAQQFDETVSNRQVSYTAMVAAAGFFYDDETLIRTALEGPRGFDYLLSVGLPSDGLWSEGTGYHEFALWLFSEIAEMAHRYGIDLYRRTVAGHTLRPMFDAPMRAARPDFSTVRTRDSGGVSLLDPKWLRAFEVGYLRYRDPRYAAFLNKAYADGTRKREPPFFTLCVPELPRTGAPEIPSESSHFDGNGIAVLRSENRVLCFDYGIVGGEHGQPERLQIEYWDDGIDWLRDPVNESYLLPNLQTWYRQTIAHNTMVVDETSQGWGNGRLLRYGTTRNLQAVSAESEVLYGGVHLRRTLLLTDSYFLDLFDAAAPEDRIYDLPVHGVGSLTLTGVDLQSAGELPFGKKPGVPGYDELTEIVRGTPAGSWEATFDNGKGRRLRMRVPDGAGTEVWKSLSPGEGGGYAEKRPMLFVRQRGASANFVSLFDSRPTGPEISGFRPGKDPGWYRVTLGDETHSLFVDPKASSFALVRSSGDRIFSCSAIHLSKLEWNGTKLFEASHSLPEFEFRIDDGRVEVDAPEACGEIRLHAPGAREVLINGKPAPVVRKGDSVVVTQKVPLLISGDGEPWVTFKGETNLRNIPLHNFGAETWTGAVRVVPAPDWRERIRRQQNDWGGIVNLTAVNKRPPFRTVDPPDRVEDLSWIGDGLSRNVVLPAGGRTAHPLLVIPPFDFPEVSLPLDITAGDSTRRIEISVQDPVEVRFDLPNSPALGWTLQVRNRTPYPQRVRLTFVPESGWSLTGPNEVTVPLAASEETRVEVPVRLISYDPKVQRYPVRLRMECGKFRKTYQRDVYVAEALRVSAPPDRNGSREGWDTSRPVTLSLPEQQARLLFGSQPWGGLDDLSAKAFLNYDDQNLYIGIDVSDSALFTRYREVHYYPSDIDSVEAIFDARTNSGQGLDPMSAGTFRHLAMPEKPELTFDSTWRGDIPLRHRQIPGATTHFHPRDGGYCIVLVLPLRSLGLEGAGPGRTVRFDLAVNDNDGSVYRKNMFLWAGYTQNQTWLDPRLLGVLLFR